MVHQASKSWRDNQHRRILRHSENGGYTMRLTSQKPAEFYSLRQTWPRSDIYNSDTNIPLTVLHFTRSQEHCTVP